MTKVEFKIKTRTRVDEAGGKTTTKLAYVPSGMHEKEIKITVTSSEVADEVGLSTGMPDDIFYIDFDVRPPTEGEIEKENAKNPKKS